MPFAVSFQKSPERSRFLSVSPSQAWRPPKPGPETNGNQLRTPGPGTLPGHSHLGSSQLGAPAALLCQARAHLSWLHPTPGPPMLGRAGVISAPGGGSISLVFILCVWTGQPGGALSTHYRLKGRQQRPGSPALPGEESAASQGASRLTRRAQGSPRKEGRTPSRRAEMLWPASRL